MVYAVIDTNIIVSSFITRNPSSSTRRIINSMLSGKIKLLYNDEILDENFEFLLRSKTLEVFQRNTRKHTLSDKTFILFLIAQPRHSTSCKPSVHIRHFHGSKNEQILIFQNRFQLIVNTHSRNAFVRLQEIASGHKQQRLTNFIELLSKLFHPCRILYVKIHNIEHIKLTQSLSLQIQHFFPSLTNFLAKTCHSIHKTTYLDKELEDIIILFSPTRPLIFFRESKPLFLGAQFAYVRSIICQPHSLSFSALYNS